MSTRPTTRARRAAGYHEPRLDGARQGGSLLVPLFSSLLKGGAVALRSCAPAATPPVGRPARGAGGAAHCAAPPLGRPGASLCVLRHTAALLTARRRPQTYTAARARVRLFFPFPPSLSSSSSCTDIETKAFLAAAPKKAPRLLHSTSAAFCNKQTKNGCRPGSMWGWNMESRIYLSHDQISALRDPDLTY